MPFTPEDIQELTSNEEFKQALSNAVNPALNGLAASLKKEFKTLQDTVASISKPSAERNDQPAAAEGTAEGMDSTEGSTRYTRADKALLQRLEALEKEREAERAENLATKRSAAISDLISSRSLTKPEIVKKLFTIDYADKLVEDGGVWYVEDGESTTALNDVFESFLKSDQGSYFIPASGTNGAGSKETRTTVGATKLDPDREAALKLAQMALNPTNQY